MDFVAKQDLQFENDLCGLCTAHVLTTAAVCPAPTPLGHSALPSTAAVVKEDF